MYEHLTVDLFNLHPPMALNAHSFGFHVVSRKYIPSYAIFHDRVEQFHDATWVGVNSDWMSQLLYEFMNSTYPFLFSDPWRSYTFQQPWKVSNNFAYMSCSWVKMLTAKADFPTPWDPLIQIILWLLVFLTLVSIARRMSLWVPSVHDLRSLNFFTPRAFTKSSSSFFSTTVFPFYDIKFSIHECRPWITDNLPWIFETPACMDLTSFAMAAGIPNKTTWTMNICTETRPCSTKISVEFIRKSI